MVSMTIAMGRWMRPIRPRRLRRPDVAVARRVEGARAASRWPLRLCFSSGDGVESEIRWIWEAFALPCDFTPKAQGLVSKKYTVEEPFKVSDFMPASLPPGAVFGVGLDLSEVTRVARACRGAGFRRQVFAPAELEAFVSGGTVDAEGLALAFAYKEAFFKALGTGQRLGMLFHEIAAPPAAPAGTLHLSGRTQEVAQSLGVAGIQAGSSMQGDAALAWVLLFG